MYTLGLKPVVDEISGDTNYLTLNAEAKVWLVAVQLSKIFGEQKFNKVHCFSIIPGESQHSWLHYWGRKEEGTRGAQFSAAAAAATTTAKRN